MFLIDAIKHNVEKEIKAYKIKQVLFLFVLCFLATTKNLLKIKENTIYTTAAY